jgi:hypothetical protein
MYREPPKLAARYHAISQIPIDVQLRQSTAKLKDWLARITHQIKVTYALYNQILPGQLTLQEAFVCARTRFRKANKYRLNKIWNSLRRIPATLTYTLVWVLSSMWSTRER